MCVTDIITYNKFTLKVLLMYNAKKIKTKMSTVNFIDSHV